MPFPHRLAPYAAALLLAAALLTARAAGAATPVYADPAMNCAGLTPCYASLQAAVNNAGPGPAEVGLFPGTYAESVDLDQMGSAIGGTPGTIRIQALDTTGQPATSGVELDPGAAGGPGAGPALSGGLTNGVFHGSVSLRGLSATSPDTTAIIVFADGDLQLQDLLAHDAGGSGLVFGVTGDASVTRLDALANVDSGVGVIANGSLTVTDATALGNGLVGLELVGGHLDASGLQASLNGEDGVTALGCTGMLMQDVQVELNTDNGLEAQVGASVCNNALTRLRDTGSFGLHALTATPGTLPTFVGGSNTSMQITQVSANRNGNLGLGAFATEGTASVMQASADDNLGGGLILQAPSLVLQDSHVRGNLFGMAVIATQAELSMVSADDSVTGANLPVEGSGIAITAAEASLDQVQASNNAFAGLLLAWINMPAQIIPHYTVANGLFTGNDQGIAAVSDGLVDVDLQAVTSSNNLAAGINLPVLSRASMADTTVSNSPIGMLLNVAQQAVVETAQVAANDTGMYMVVQPGAAARVSCSNFNGNPTVGLQLAQGAAVDARANYWGAISGPTHPGNPGGSGDAVGDAATGDAGSVDYSGFLAQPASVDDCPKLALPPYTPVPMLDARSLLLLALLLLATGWRLRRVRRR